MEHRRCENKSALFKTVRFISQMTLFETYEKRYGNLTSEITFKLTKIPNLSGDERKKEVHETSLLFDETKELLEQMSLEVQEIRSDNKPKFINRLECYKKELEKLSNEFKRPRYAPHRPEYRDVGREDDELHEEILFDSDMRAQLLSNTERVARSTTRLEDGVRVALQTEEIGGHILTDLGEQREKLQRSRDRLREADSDLTKSSRFISAISRRALQSRFLLYAVAFFLILIFIVAIYLFTRQPSTSPPVVPPSKNNSHS